jgi:phosphatidate cytidylyltransferase
MTPFLFGREAWWVGGIVLGMLVAASVVGYVLAKRTTSPGGIKTVANLNARTRAWWVMAIIFATALALGRVGVTVLFGLMSFFALREMLTLAPSRRGDHRTLFWAFFVVVPVQYVLIYLGRYGLFSIFIPVYCFLFFALRSAMAGDVTRYLERAAKIHWGVMICVYCISHCAALLLLKLPNFDGRQWQLIVFLVFIAQVSDVLQYVWGKLLGRRPIAAQLSPNKTVGGYVLGTLSATAIGGLLHGMTPFGPWWALGLALVITQMGFVGGLVMSAVKRDAGVKDYGHLIEGHGGVMDRVDSLAFAAPVFFHLVRFFFETPAG